MINTFQKFQKAIPAVLWCIIFCIAVHFSGYLSNPHGVFITFWPPAGLGVFLLFRYGFKYWPIIWIGTFTGSILSHFNELIPSLSYATGATIEALSVVFLAKKLTFNSNTGLPWLRYLTKAGAIAVPISCMIGAVISVGGLRWSGMLEWDATWINGVVRANADILGILFIGNSLFELFQIQKNRVLNAKPLKIFEGTLLAFTCGMTSWLAFNIALPITLPVYFMMLTILLLVVLWATLSFAILGTTLSLTMIAIISTMSTAHGHGPFATEPDAAKVLELQFFLLFIGIMRFTHALGVRNNREMADRLSSSKNIIEEELQERTKHLLREIDEKNTAQNEIKRESHFSNTILDTSASLVIVLDSDGNLIRFNPACEKTSGFKSKEVLGQKYWNLSFNGTSIPTPKDIFMQLRSGTYPIEYDSYWRAKDGSLRWILWNFTCVTKKDHSLELVIGTGMDLTERKKAERELKEKDEQLGLAMEAGKMGGWFLNFATGELHWFGSTQQLLGAGENEFLGTLDSGMEFIHPEDRQNVTNAIRESIDQGSSFFVEFRTKNSSALWLQCFGKVLLDHDQKTTQNLAGVIIDVTDRKKLEAEQLKVLEDTQKLLQQREDFINIASHELKTPLTPLKMHLDLLKNTILVSETKTIDRPKLSLLFEIADKQMRFLVRLVDSLLDISRINANRLILNRSLIDLNQVVKDSVSYINSSTLKTPESITFNLSPEVKGEWDPTRLEQVVINLLSNAMRYGLGKPITITSKLSGSQAVLIVEDQGVGIDPKDHKRIFEQFERATAIKKYAGLGLGLYITKKIVLAHGGTIDVKSNVGSGATFMVSLPLQPNGS